MKKNNLNFRFVITILTMLIVIQAFSATVTITPTGGDDTSLIQTAINGLNSGDKLVLNGDFVFNRTIYLKSNMIWELRGTLTLAPNSANFMDVYGEVRTGFNNSKATAIASPIGMKNTEFYGGTIYGNGDLNGQAVGLPSVRQVNMVFAEDCYFHDFTVEDTSDDCFTLGSVSHHNKVERVTGRHAGGKINKIGGNALTDNGDNNTWIDCIADQGGSDGWTPKCRNSTFIRCIASNNMGPGWGMYAREEGYASNRDVGAIITGNRFIDCVAYGSTTSSGFAFDISSNCPGGIIKDNFIQAVCYNNNSSGVSFRNKDNAKSGIIKNNVVDIICYGNKSLTSTGNINSWGGGIGMENDNSLTNNLNEYITGSVICYDNTSVDVNTRGGTNCTIKVYRPSDRSAPILGDKSSGINTVTVINFSCSDQLTEWCQRKYCGVASPAPLVTSVTLTPATATIAAGTSLQLSKSVLPLSALNQMVVYSSDKTAIAKVDRNGLVTAMSVGTAIITATTEDGGKTASSNITVTAAVIVPVSEFLDNCDAITGWNTAATLKTLDKKQGTASLESISTMTSSSTVFSKAFTTPYDSAATPVNGQLKFWFYVSDITTVGEVRVELSSSGAPDVDEYQWLLTGLTNGWNQLTLNINKATVTGTPNLSAINWFRIYTKNRTGTTTTRLDAIQVGTASALGINDLQYINKSVKIYPNPLKNNIMSIDLTGFEDQNNVTIRISNLLGQTVYQKNVDTTTHFEINTSEILKKSIYLVSVESVDSKITQKLIVQ